MTDRRWTIPERRKPLTPKQYVELFLRQDGRCGCGCNARLEVKGGVEVEIIDEHIQPLFRGGSNDLDNRALFSKPCAIAKTREEATERAKGRRAMERYIGAPKRRKGRPLAGTVESGWRHKMDGSWERR